MIRKPHNTHLTTSYQIPGTDISKATPGNTTWWLFSSFGGKWPDADALRGIGNILDLA
jgi:hypothetical protein